MDQERFDQLTRAALQIRSRRELVRLAAAALGGGVLAVAEDAPSSLADKGKHRPKKKKNCPKGTTRCGAMCVNLTRDPQNCGTCNNACGAVRTCCNAACVDTNADPTNCGTCSHLCAEDQACLNGSCQRCAQGQSVCTDAAGFQFCADLNSDQNCGACGRACPKDETCQAGAGGVGLRCVCPGPRCPVGNGTTNCCPVADGVCCKSGACCPGSLPQCVADGQCCGAGDSYCGGGQCCPVGTSCGARGDCLGPCC